MRYSTEHKAQTKARIVRSAGKLFAARGFDATSIDAIMRACNLTRGGFYAHFKSKSQLYRHAIESATSRIKGRHESQRTGDDGSCIDSLLNDYLNIDGAQSTGGDSRLTFLATDVASEDHEVRSVYESAFKTMCSQLASRVAVHTAGGEEIILPIAVMIVGVRAIAQSIDDVALREKLWASCRAATKAQLENRSEAPLSFFWDARLERDAQRFRSLTQ